MKCQSSWPSDEVLLKTKSQLFILFDYLALQNCCTEQFIGGIRYFSVCI